MVKYYFLSISIALFVLVGCGDDDQKDSSATITSSSQASGELPPPSKPHRKRIILDNCDNPPADAVMFEQLPEVLQAMTSINCRRHIGHQLAGPKGFVWMYATISYDGFQVPDLAIINANYNTEEFPDSIHDGEDNFHRSYFTSIELETLSEEHYSETLNLLRKENPDKHFARRAIAQRIKAVNNKQQEQYVYLFADVPEENIARKTIGFLCAPDCQYTKIFTVEVWLDASERTKELLKEFGPEARAREAAAKEKAKK